MLVTKRNVLFGVQTKNNWARTFWNYEQSVNGCNLLVHYSVTYFLYLLKALNFDQDAITKTENLQMYFKMAIWKPFGQGFLNAFDTVW